MIACSNCDHQNPADAKFCQNCGHSLALVCSNCQTSNGADAKFCKNCGTRLKAGAPTPPSQPEAKELSAEKEEGERRIITVLFCDVSGSTALSEQLDPEEWTEIMNGLFERLIAAVSRYEGTVTRLMGDAILALFGAPIAHEDDPYRSILAALDMLEDIRPYQEEIRQRFRQAGIQPAPTDFEIRVGINTGLAIVGQVGSHHRQEYTAMGDAVNLAARMEQTTRPGTIQISQDTYRLIAPLVEVEPLGPVEVKGKRDPVPAYRVVGLKAKPGRLRGLEGVESTLVGRQREMSLLRFAREQLLDGYGQIICLIGEAGLGKSRLVHEFKQLNASNTPVNGPDSRNGREVMWYESESLSFETTHPYSLFQRLIRRMGGITQDDPPASINGKINRLLQDLPDSEQARVGRALEALIGLETQDGEPRLHGEDLKRELLEGMLALTRSLAATRPTVLTFEDLHWADPASVELIRQLFTLSDQVPLLFLCVFRPDHHAPAWTVKQTAETTYRHRYQEIALGPLSAEESNALASSLLEVAELPQELGGLILEKTDGVPFFVEEIVQELIERGILMPAENGNGWRLVSEISDIDIPDNIEAILVARMDRLERETRHTLQLASVIGRTFFFRVLEMVADTIDHLDQHLRALQQVGMLKESARVPELEYMFRHVLAQEAAYNTILHRRRRQYHQHAGEVMERLFASHLDEYAPLLAHHFHEARDYERSLKYFSMAAENAARLFANDEAVTHYTQAIMVAEKISLETTSQAALYRGRGLAGERRGDFEGARGDHEAALSLARTAGELPIEWLALLDLGKLWASRDYDRAGDYFQQALALARKMGDPASLARSLNRVGNWYVNAEQPLEGIRYHQEALDIFKRLGDRHALAETLDLLGMGNLLGGDLLASVDFYQEAIALFREVDDRPGLVSSLPTLVICGGSYKVQTAFTSFDPNEARAAGEQGLELAREMGWRAGESYALWILAAYHDEQSNFAEALDAAQASLRVAIDIGHHQWMAAARATIGHIYLDLLAPDEARNQLELALALAQEVRTRYWINQASSFLAISYLSLNQLEMAQNCLAAVLSTDTPAQSISQRNLWLAKSELAKAQGNFDLTLEIGDRLITTASNMAPGRVIPALWKLRGETLLALGKTDEAETVLQSGIKRARKRGERSLLWRTHAILGKLYRLKNQQPLAESEFFQARAIIEALAKTVPDQALRENFLIEAGVYVDGS